MLMVAIKKILFYFLDTFLALYARKSYLIEEKTKTNQPISMMREKYGRRMNRETEKGKLGEAR